MKLSDIKGPRTFDVIADIVGPIARIASDEEAMELFSPRETPEGMTQVQFFAQRASAAAPALLRTHKADVVEILASINGVTPEEYEREITMARLLSDVVDVLTDGDLLSFFKLRETETQS